MVLKLFLYGYSTMERVIEVSVHRGKSEKKEGVCNLRLFSAVVSTRGCQQWARVELVALARPLEIEPQTRLASSKTQCERALQPKASES